MSTTMLPQRPRGARGSMPTPRPAVTASGAGMTLAVVSAAACATSGTLGKALYAAGWSPGAAILVRIGGAALLLLVPAALALRGRWPLLWRNRGLVTVFGLVAVAGSQLFYFQAVARLSVGVALLVEYLAPVLVVAWQWASNRARPSGTTLSGVLVAVVGLALMVDPGGGRDVDLLGLGWGLAAAACLAVYFVLSARDGGGLPPVVVVAGGMVVGSIALLLAGVAGVVTLAATTAVVPFGSGQVSWLVPALGLVLVPGVLGYLAGVAGARRLGARVAAFVSLVEVVFAVVVAWWWLGELPVAVQFVGGALILAGVVLVRLGDADRSSPPPGATPPPLRMTPRPDLPGPSPAPYPAPPLAGVDREPTAPPPPGVVACPGGPQ